MTFEMLRIEMTLLAKQVELGMNPFPAKLDTHFDMKQLSRENVRRPVMEQTENSPS